MPLLQQLRLVCQQELGSLPLAMLLLMVLDLLLWSHRHQQGDLVGRHSVGHGLRQWGQ